MDKLNRKRERDETQLEASTFSSDNPPAKQAKVETQASAKGSSQSAESAEVQHLTGVLARDSRVRIEEEKSELEFRVIRNDGSVENLQLLLAAKDIISHGLINMPKEYITRFVMDRYHETLLALKRGRPIGTCVFRPFRAQNFAEVVFLAVLGDYQIHGYGSRLMNHMKNYAKGIGIRYFFTYADNNAIPYFRKQGFTKVTEEDGAWKGFIKDYDKATLMECPIHDKIDYTNVPAMLAAQKQELMRLIRERQEVAVQSSVHKGLNFDTHTRVIPIRDIPGVRTVPSFRYLSNFPERTWTSKEERDLEIFKGKLRRILEKMKKAKSAWPFQEPVDGKVVSDYYQIITQPMDFRTMSRKIHENQYMDQESFFDDMMRIFNNARSYNGADTIYFQCANECEEFFRSEFEKVFSSSKKTTV